MPGLGQPVKAASSATVARSIRLYDFQSFYSLTRSEAGYKMASICHNKIPRLVTCAGPL